MTDYWNNRSDVWMTNYWLRGQLSEWQITGITSHMSDWQIAGMIGQLSEWQITG